jgi:hypothetical protein
VLDICAAGEQRPCRRSRALRRTCAPVTRRNCGAHRVDRKPCAKWCGSNGEGAARAVLGSDHMSDNDETPASPFLLIAEITMWSTLTLGVIAVMVVALLT